MFFALLVHRLKLECEKLTNDKTEMQRHYVMVSTKDSNSNLSTLLRQNFEIMCTASILRCAHLLFV